MIDEIACRKLTSSLTKARKAVLSVCMCVLLACAGLAFDALSSASRAANYLLGVGDEIAVSVYQQKDFTTKVKVNVDGGISLPLLGEVEAAGYDIAGLQHYLQKRLVDEGYFTNPNVTVDLVTARPFFIDGDVTRPGPHPFEAQLTVRRAVAIAGGYDVIRLKVDNPVLLAADLRSRYVTLSTEYVKTEAHVLNIQAQLSGRNVDFSSLSSATSLPPDAFRDLVRLETDRYQAALKVTALQRAHAERTLALSKDEVSDLVTGQRADELATSAEGQSLDRVKELSARGITPVTRVDEGQRLYSVQRSRELETQSRLARARNSLEAAQDAIDHLDVDRKAALSKELQEALLQADASRDELKSVEEKMLYVGAVNARMADSGHEQPNLAIYRSSGGHSAWIKADEDTLVEPGDVIDVAFSAEKIMLTGSRLTH